MSNYDSLIRLTAGLISYWALDEESGTAFVDTLGDNDAAITGGVTLGVLGTVSSELAAEFNGSTGKATKAYVAELNPTQTSVECWVLVDVIGAGNYEFVSGQDTTGFKGYQLGMISAGNVRFSVGDGVNIAGSQSAAMLTPGTWYHVVGTFDGANTRIYLDGVLEDGPDARTLVQQTTKDTVLGARNDPADRYLDGRLQKVAIYNRALTPTEVQSHYLVGTAEAVGHSFGATIKAGKTKTHTFGGTLIHRRQHTFGAYIATPAFPKNYGELTTTQRNALFGLAVGDTVLNTTTETLQQWDGSAWMDLADVWTLDGDAKGTLPIFTAADLPSRLPIGSPGNILMQDPMELEGLRWDASAFYIRELITQVDYTKTTPNGTQQAEVSLMQMQILANLLTVGSHIDFVLRGLINVNSNQPALDFRLRIGTSATFTSNPTVILLNTFTTNNTTNAGWRLVGQAGFSDTDSTGAVRGQDDYLTEMNTQLTYALEMSATTADTAIDGTQLLYVDFTADWSQHGTGHVLHIDTGEMGLLLETP